MIGFPNLRDDLGCDPDRILVLPESEHRPTGMLQERGHPFITGTVARDLGSPEFRVAFGDCVVLRAPVPKASVHEDRYSAACEYQVCS